MDRHAFDPTGPAAGADDPAPRSDARDSMFLAASFTADGLPSEQVRVRNLSAGGMMVEYPAPIRAGTAVSVELRGIGRVPGRIAWAIDGRLGVAFDHPIDPRRARKPVGTRAR